MSNQTSQSEAAGDALLGGLALHIQRMCRARYEFRQQSTDPNAKRVDSSAADDADYALCSFVERNGTAIVARMNKISAPSAHTEAVKRLVEAAKAFCSDVANAPDTMTFSAQAIAMVNRNVDAFQSALTAYQQSVGGGS